MKFLTQEEKLTDIAKEYKEFECDKAADAIAASLKKNKQKGEIIELFFENAYYGYVCSERLGYNNAISLTGMHCGVEYNGIVYCNIYPEGLPELQWIASFSDASGNRPKVNRIPIG